MYTKDRNSAGSNEKVTGIKRIDELNDAELDEFYCTCGNVGTFRRPRSDLAPGELCPPSLLSRYHILKNFEFST